MCERRERDRDMRREDEQSLDEIRRLFERYRRIARHGVAHEREETAEPAVEEEPREDRVLVRR